MNHHRTSWGVLYLGPNTFIDASSRTSRSSADAAAADWNRLFGEGSAAVVCLAATVHPKGGLDWWLGDDTAQSINKEIT